MEKKMENEMETGGNIGIKELKLSCGFGVHGLPIYKESPLRAMDVYK